jgi:hypothetical protein
MGIIKAIAWSPYVQNAKKNLEAWERKVEQRGRAATNRQHDHVA